MYIDKLIKKEIITLLISVSLLVVIFIGVTYAKFLSVDNGKDTVINVGDLSISFCNDSNCDSTYSNIGQVIGTKVENGVTVPAGIYPYKGTSSYSDSTPYIFKVTNTGTLASTLKIKLKEDAAFVPSGDYAGYNRLTTKYADHLKVAIRKRVLYKDTGYQLGDVNMDGFVNEADTNFIFRANADLLTLSEVQKTLADVNCDGKINNKDVVLLSRMLSGNNQTESLESTYIYSYSEIENNVIYSDDIIKAGEEAIYFIWLYLDNTTPNDAQKTFFVGNLDVVGEYIPKVSPVSFSTDSWDTIVNAVRENNTDVYNVGDTKEIDLGDYGTHTVRIANKSTPSECSTQGFSQTACGFVLEFTDIITTHNINDEISSEGGFPSSVMRTFINNDIYNAFPSGVKEQIASTFVASGANKDYEEGEAVTSTDKLFLLSLSEIYSNDIEELTSDGAIAFTRQLDYYANKRVSTSNHNAAIKKYNGTNSVWWLRTATSRSYSNFLSVLADGTWNITYSADRVYGVSPAFRIG